MQRAAVVMLITSSGMAFALIADLLIALKFGTSGSSDMLIIGISLPLFVDTVFREGARFSVLPWLARIRKDFSNSEYNRILSAIIVAFVAFGLLLGTVTFLFAGGIVSLLAPGYGPELIDVGANVLKASSFAIAFAMPNTLLSAHLNAHEKFYVVALRNAVTPVVLILGFSLFWSDELLLLVVGSCYSIAASAYFFVLARAAIRTGYSFRFVIRQDWSRLREVLVLVSLPVLGYLSLQGSRIAVRVMATQIGIGCVAAFYFAFRIASAVQTIVGVSIATIGLPRMATKYLRGKLSGISELRRPILFSVALTLLAMALVWLLSDWFFAVVANHVHGIKFDPRSVSDTLKFLSIGFVFSALLPIVQSFLYAQYRVAAVVRNMVINAVLVAVVSLILYPNHGLRGLAVAYVGAAMLSLVEVSMTVRRVRSHLSLEDRVV